MLKCGMFPSHWGLAGPCGYTLIKSFVLLIWDTRTKELYGDQDGIPSGRSCPLTGDLASSTCVCGCVDNGISATAATWVCYYSYMACILCASAAAIVFKRGLKTSILYHTKTATTKNVWIYVALYCVKCNKPTMTRRF